MKRTIKFILPLLFYIIFLILTLLSPMLIKKVVLEAIDIWINNIIPSLLPFYILSEFLINYGFVDLFSYLTNNITYSLFKINGEASFVLILSLLSGTPSNAKYIKMLRDKSLINDMEGTKLLTFTHFINPLFIIGITNLLFNNYKITLFIMGSHYLTNIIIGILFRNYYISPKQKRSLKDSIYNQVRYNFSTTLSNAIQKSFNILILILGTIIFFLLIINITNYYLNINQYYQCLINGLIEITSGVNYLTKINLPIIYIASLLTFFLSFGGLSIHMQTKSIINNTQIKYFPYLIARLIHASISSLVVYFLINTYYM